MDPVHPAQHPLVTESDFAGFLGVVIHQYHNIQLDLVWDYAQEDLPALKDAVAALLADLEDAGAL